ncbi:MAG TPA: hypothetical protein DCZ95_07965 [Verrucomicrobia bacterium]|nr:hypothetical protein [Verrucomicrobiota bacterium]
MIRLYTKMFLAALAVFIGVTIYAAETNKTPSLTSQKKAELLQRASGNDFNAVSALGESADPSLIPELSRLLKEKKQTGIHPTYVRAIKRSLAMLGEPSARKEIIEDLNRDAQTRYYAFEDAAVVGGNDMIAAIASKLYDSTPGGRIPESGGTLARDVALPAPRHAAVIELSRMIKDPSAPIIDLKRIRYDEESVKKWQKWWEANSNKYQNVQIH